MWSVKALGVAAIVGLAQAQGQHNGVDCAQALTDMSDDLNHVSRLPTGGSCSVWPCVKVPRHLSRAHELR